MAFSSPATKAAVGARGSRLLRQLRCYPDRSPDEQRDRLYRAAMKRTRKAQARLRWKATGGESTLRERLAATGAQ